MTDCFFPQGVSMLNSEPDDDRQLINSIRTHHIPIPRHDTWEHDVRFEPPENIRQVHDRSLLAAPQIELAQTEMIWTPDRRERFTVWVLRQVV